MRPAARAAFPGARRQAIPADPREWVAPAPGAGRLPLEVRAHADVRLADWARAHPEVLDAWLAEHGAVLFAGFGVSLDDFADVAAAVAGPPLPYRERSSPRAQVAPGIYTSTEYPPDQAIPVHNENSYQAAFPSRLAFCCLSPAGRGGATPLADCRRVLARIDPGVLAAFRNRHVRYVRNYGPELGLSWAEAFGETQPEGVDRYCREHGLTPAWLPGGRLRTTAVRPATGRHPGSGQEVWFNHAAFFHVSALGPAVSAALLDQLGEASLPSNAYYGDGGPIEPEALENIRAAYAAETRSVPWRPGDVLVVDNILAAHGREPFAGSRRIVVSMAGTRTHQDLSAAPGASR
jgi:alpha-ketoglutarate-dependent taurine dioxygenase